MVNKHINKHIWKHQAENFLKGTQLHHLVQNHLIERQEDRWQAGEVEALELNTQFRTQLRSLGHLGAIPPS